MNINQHFSNLATKAAQDGADASQLISQRERLFKDKVIPELTKRGANDTAIVQAREKWYSQTDKVMQNAGLLPKAGQNSRSFAKDKRADKANREAVKTGSNFPIIKEALKSTGETIGNLFGQGVGGMIEGAAGFVRDIGENEKNSTSARIAKYGKNLKKDYENSASTFQKELQGGQHGKIPQLSAGAIQSVPAMALPFGAAKGVATVATKVPILASKAPYLGIVAGKAAEHTQNYGEVRRNATANLERDFPTWEKLQGNPLFEQNFNERLNNGLTITQAREQAYAATLDQLSEKASDKYGTAMTAIGFIAPSGAVLGSGILKNAPTSKIGKALTGGGVDSALVKREMQQVPRTGMAKLVPDMSIAANKAAAKMVGKQALEEGLQGGIGEYGAQAASANIGGTPVDYGKVGQTILEEGLVGGIMGGGMQSATGGSPTSQAKDVAKQLRNQTNTLRQEEAAARKELADAMQLNDPAALQSAQDNLNNIGAEASKVKAAYDQYGIDTPYFVERFAAQYQPPKQQEQEPPVVEPEVQPEVQPEVEPQPTEQPQATPINQGMANTTNLVMDSVSNGYITPEEAQVIQTDPIRADVFTLTMTGDEAAAHNVVMNAVSLGNIDTDQAQELIQSITRYSQAKAPKKPTISNIVNNHVKQQIHPQDKGLFSNQVELDPETFEPVDPNQPSPFQEDFNEPKEFYNAAKANDYVRINGLTESHDIESADDGTLIVVKKQGIIPDDPNLNSFGYSPENIVQPTPADPNLSNFSEGPVSVDSLNLENVPDVIDPEEVQQPVESIPKAQPDHNKHKTFTNYVRANDFVKQNGLKESHEIITKGEGQVIVQPKSAEPVEDFGSDQEFDDVLSAVPPIGTPSQDPVEPVQAADPATDFDSDEAFDELLNAVPPSDKQTDPVQPTDSFADQVRDAHLNNPKAKPKLIQDEINKGRPRAEVLAEVSDIVKAINTITTPELKTDTPEPETPAQTPIEQKTDESGIQKNDAPEGIKSGDIGRGSDGKPFLSKNAANRGLKLRDVEKTHEVVEISPSNFVLRAKETVPGVDKPQESDNPYQKYDDLAKQYGRSIKPDGIIVARNGQDTAFKIQEKNGRLHIKDVLGNLAFSGATTPESLGKFLEDYWYDKKDQSNQKEQAPAENSVLDTPAPEEMKKGDVGRKSDNQPFASATAAKTTIKKQGLDNSHEVVQLAPSQFVLREKAKSEDDSLESGSEELALADLPHPPFQRNDTPGTIKKKDIGRASDNKPFANKSAATTTIKKEGLSDTHEVVQLAPSQFVLREKLDSEQEQNESSISDMNNAKQSIDRTVTLVTHDHFLKGSLGDTQHSKSEIIRSIPNEMMDQVHKLEDIFSDLSSLQADEVKTNVTYNKELLIKLAKLNPDVQVHIVSDLANSSDLIIQSISDQLLEGGFYSIDSRISYIYPRSSEWKGTVSELINHELIHAATQEYIDTDKLTPEQLEHLDEIKETIWSNNRESFDNIDSDVLDRINYAIFTSYPHEMFTVFGAESSPREILSQIGILDRFDTIFNNVLKEAANDNGQIKQRSSGRFNEEGTSERVSGNAFRVPGTISAIRTTTSSSENIERSPSNQPASLSSPEKDEVGQVDDKRKQESNSGSDSPLRSRTKNQKVQGSNPNQVRAELVSRFGGDTIQQLEQKGILSIVPTYAEQGVEGFAENGRVTLVADAITPENIVPVFLHELGGHIGMQGVLKASAYDNLMSEFNRLVKSGNPDAIEAKRLAERESDAQVQADEYLPYLITVAARNQQNQGPAQKLINRVLSAVKAWAVDRLGLNLKLNSNDMVALAERMIKTISKGTPPTPPKGERRYSRGSTTNPQNMSQTKQRELLDKAASTAFGQMSLRGAEGAKTLSSRTLNLFQTMLHKSLRDETGQFKKTFDLVQGKINHVTFASSKSMDVAPNVLIQLEQGEDYWKEVKRVGRTIGHTFSGGKIDKAKVDKDLKKVGDLMFENTLMDNSERHSVKELKQLGFDDDQIGLYNEVRDAIDTSLDTFANTTFSNIYKHLGGTNEEVLELAAQDLDIVDHYNEILKRIDTLTKGKPEKAEARQAAIEAIDRVFKKANDLKDQGYVPLMRFGKYFVRIYNPTTGEVAYRQHFESESERNLFYRNYDQSKIPAGYEIEQGQINELQHKLFQGVSPETVALFAKESGLPIGDAETAYIKYAVQNNPNLKRLLKRQGIEGFDSDLKRVLASFVMSNARYSANQSYNPAIDESITNIEDPAFQEDAIRLRDYSLDTQEELAAVKNFAFVWYMGFSAMFGVVNLTQPLLQTFPYLMQYSRDKGTILRAFRKAVITWRKGTDAMDRKYKDHYERARKEGHLDPQNTWMMQGLERGKSGLGASTWQLISHASGLFAQASEAVNRRTSLFAALDVAESLGQAKLEKLGFKDAYDFAVRTIQETQGIYNKGNRPRLARGNIGSALMMYKQFMIAYIEQMVRMQKAGLYGGEDDEFKKKMAALVGFGVSRSILTMLGILMALSGTTGLPFVRDILDVVETAGGLMGKPVNTEREIQIALQDALGQTLGNGVNTVLMDGIVNLNPLIDVKGRMGMGDLIPATAYFSPTTSDYMKSSEISQIAGPIGGLLEKVKESVALAQVGAYGQSGVQLLPKAITSVGQGAIAATTGDYRNMKTGVKTNDVEAWEGIIKMLDAQPASIAKEGRFRGMELKDKSAQTYVNARWKERYVNALESGDRTQVRAVKQEINDYNKDNPRYPIKFNQKLAETNYNKSNQTWQEKRKIVKGLEWMSEYNPHLKQ
ncbi:PLxRFG domain-containing protein [Acinetobacter sp. NEB149]|uniref:PLxRFG domain-containing protein n=1 Tax=Acinetobacter TaxID=469 RepID=UPI001448CF95|nr:MULTISPECIES: PLxRFG domain-containing protein [Acinetobacter]QJB47503.1 PLxRFG domain-containing protein [Acinetobacter sp. NEB149]QZD32669.1 hypothetical protein ABEKA_0621 [Acinetobacter lwoffii]